ncbi:hypothetical protein E2C01_032884 [Portunus trituberculatus]|uniref:Uncharacterized protein n=1 Tax=Portunus trituberculatus TaxID=210409 RepID=A0A5B7EWE1_PORTR|nr:hypothetical protein [Portunus trituberculatus]
MSYNLQGPPWYSRTMRALGSEGSQSARVRILSMVRVHEVNGLVATGQHKNEASKARGCHVEVAARNGQSCHISFRSYVLVQSE